MRGNTFYSDFDTESLREESRRPDEYRTPFQVNRDRIIHTSAFRRLQSKTQVFLSGEYDFYRTRLTHSIEVAQIGRSICASLKSRSDFLGEEFYIDPELVEAACLAHDLGHPPFGHAGERTLNRLMKESGGFEGNAQTLRMLTQTIFTGRRRGMNPTRALLDSILKYRTLHGELDDPENHFLYDEQGEYLGFVHAGEKFPSELVPGKRRDGFRSIECEIMDWADDTAYSLNDVADGVNAGFLTLGRLERWAGDLGLEGADAAHLEELMAAIREERVEGLMGRKIGNFIGACELVKRDDFMSAKTNRHQFGLQVEDSVKNESRLYKRMAFEIVFRSPQLAQLDRKADHLLGAMFEVLSKNYVDAGAGGPRWRLLPPAAEEAIAEARDRRERARLVCDTIAAMTDGLAVRTYKRLFDADFGSIVDLV